MHLSKSEGRSPKAKPATEDAPTTRLPGPSAQTFSGNLRAGPDRSRRSGPRL